MVEKLSSQTVDLEINGSQYEFSTDYRLFIELATIFTNKEPPEVFFSFCQLHNLPYCDETVFALKKLYTEEKETKWKQKTKPKKQNFVIKFDVLWDLIYSGFLKTYDIDLESIEYLHFNKFRAMLYETRNTRLNTVLEAWGKDLGKLKGEQKDECKRLREEYPLTNDVKVNVELYQKEGETLPDYIKRLNEMEQNQ